MSGKKVSCEHLKARRGSGIATLAQLRHTVLPRHISGELPVPDAEAFLREGPL